ncbi:MAG: hypothetical protein ACKOTB_03110 [Planctomycetia bacterium]
MIALALVLMARPAAADPIASSYVYGIDNSGFIWELDPVQKTQRSVFDTLLGGTTNAFAYDNSRDQMFFVDSSKNLWYWNHATTVSQIATASQLGVSSLPQPWNAAYYANAYWFFNTESDELSKVSLTYGGGTPAFDSLTTYAISGIPYTTVPGDRNRFGDIAIVTSGGAAGMLYAATASPSGTDAMFYSLDLNSLTTTGVATVIKATGNPNLQLSFNADESVLYGQDSAGAWYELDLGTGNLGSPIAGFTTLAFRDLAGADNTRAAVPEIPSGGAGAALSVLAAGLALVDRRSRRTVRGDQPRP